MVRTLCASDVLRVFGADLAGLASGTRSAPRTVVRPTDLSAGPLIGQTPDTPRAAPWNAARNAVARPWNWRLHGQSRPCERGKHVASRSGSRHIACGCVRDIDVGMRGPALASRNLLLLGRSMPSRRPLLLAQLRRQRAAHRGVRGQRRPRDQLAGDARWFRKPRPGQRRRDRVVCLEHRARRRPVPASAGRQHRPGGAGPVRLRGPVPGAPDRRRPEARREHSGHPPAADPGQVGPGAGRGGSGSNPSATSARERGSPAGRRPRSGSLPRPRRRARSRSAGPSSPLPDESWTSTAGFDSSPTPARSHRPSRSRPTARPSRATGSSGSR